MQQPQRVHVSRPSHCCRACRTGLSRHAFPAVHKVLTPPQVWTHNEGTPTTQRRDPQKVHVWAASACIAEWWRRNSMLTGQRRRQASWSSAVPAAKPVQQTYHHTQSTNASSTTGSKPRQMLWFEQAQAHTKQQGTLPCSDTAMQTSSLLCVRHPSSGRLAHPADGALL